MPGKRSGQRPKKYKVKLVGGGSTWSRARDHKAESGSMKSARRLKRKLERANKKMRKSRAAA